ncbi:regulatory protein, luxR family [Pedococcus dokdonensis]|uniref:Regulatory protein, luxR family n=1 Tax=Pedococcus dokdonensis TaxID=443156 RepID=A0A1H0PZP2_9MICO|nr:LuxR family transcriptional regulator [Pedococcus dokdonensis]SDP10290.1 regulatory protein, luxR family [Pedococcus dokdonensis]
MGAQPVLVGREPQRAALRAVVQRAAAGEPGMFLLHGEAGIGKTSLVREAAAVGGQTGCHVLFGRCLRFGADVTSYVPFTQAFNQWLRTANSDSLDRLAPHRDLDDLVPALTDRSGGLALLQIGAAVGRIQDDGPTVLVVDDLQWSDPSSLDVLSYLVAGFVPGQRLAILATYRDTDLGEGHRLHGWLADALRMPSVSQAALGRMDAWTVEELVLARGAAGTAPGLAEEVLRRSGGNPYLADLLIAEAGSSDEREQPGGRRLVDALSASWHRLSAPGRRVTQLLAVAGAPVAYPVLRDLAALHGIAPDGTSTALAETAAQGITVETETGAIWFRHPLLAETIAGSMRHQERVDLHAELAAQWHGAVDVDERDRANFLALHYVQAGASDEAFAWSLRAADEAGTIRAKDEESHHLSTAAHLVDQLSHAMAATVDDVALLMRAGRAAESAGDGPAAVSHLECALARVDRSTSDSKLLAARILLHLHTLRDWAGDGSTPTTTDDPLEVLALTKDLSDSEERALGFAQLAWAEMWNGLEGAGDHAETAVRLAELVDTPPALIWSLGARALTRSGTGEAVADAERAFALALAHGDTRLYSWATVFVGNSLESAGRFAEASAIAGSSYQTLRDAGEFDFAADVGWGAALWDFGLGRWPQARRMVRELLTLARSDHSAMGARCVAALLCAHEGRPASALLHLRRARELRPHPSPVGEPLVDTQIRVSLALGDHRTALKTIRKHVTAALHVYPPTADEWLMYASQAAAELVDHGDVPERDEALRLLALIEAARGLEPPPFAPVGPLDAVHPAYGALHAAQRAHCLGAGAELADLWEAACAATLAAGLRYEHARALYRLAHHLLTQGQDRARASAALVTARDIAVDIGAGPLTDGINSLAAQAHIVLPSTRPDAAPSPGRTLALPANPPLTPREEEVLVGLLTGQTYSQIAAQLFISDKTVSTHVSNVLRKTGTANRIELAELARRGSAPGL